MFSSKRRKWDEFEPGSDCLAIVYHGYTYYEGKGGANTQKKISDNYGAAKETNDKTNCFCELRCKRAFKIPFQEVDRSNKEVVILNYSLDAFVEPTL